MMEISWRGYVTNKEIYRGSLLVLMVDSVKSYQAVRSVALLTIQGHTS